jgi:hypothetical protein
MMPEEKAYYPVSDLFLFPVYTRETYEKATGVQAPPFDPQYRIKRWLDPDMRDNSLAGEKATYMYLDFADGKVKTFEISAFEAGRVNLPGKYRYAPYVPAPTEAVVVGPQPLAPQPYNERYLSTYDEAKTLAADLQATDIVQEDLFQGGPFRIEWGSEKRRNYSIVVGGEKYNVGLLLMARHANGYGNPGRWEITARGPVWVAATQFDGTNDPRPEVPVPIRGLRQNEAVKLRPFGAPMIYRTDMESPFNEATTFEGKVLAALARIEAALARK